MTNPLLLGTRSFREECQVQEIDIWRAAQQMRKLHGADAAIHAAMRADDLLARGDVDGFAAWKRVVTAVNELDRVTARDGEARH